MDKKLQSDLYGFFCKDPEVWDRILVEDTEKGYREKGEIGSCCSYHALEQFVTAIGGDDTSIEGEVKAIKPGLDKEVLDAISSWQCDDDEHNESIQEILDIAKKEIKN